MAEAYAKAAIWRTSETHAANVMLIAEMTSIRTKRPRLDEKLARAHAELPMIDSLSTDLTALRRLLQRALSSSESACNPKPSTGMLAGRATASS